MEFRVASKEGVTIMTVSGRFDAPAAPEAERAFGELTSAPVSRCILDFSGVEYISSGGLRSLLALSRALSKSNSRLKLCGLNPFVTEVFEVSRFSGLFEIHADERAALAAYQNEAEKG